MVATIIHGVEIVQIQSYFWSVFSCIRTRNNSVFGHFSRSDHIEEIDSSFHLQEWN